MADVTGRTYEAFTEFILRRLGYRDEWTDGSGRQYLYEKAPKALCYQSLDICPHAQECDVFSKQHQIPYGPWYDPDFFILENGQPVACIHITHWSNPMSSQYKFWRSIEDHLQYKVFYGYTFLSVNLVFDTLDHHQLPCAVVDSDDIVSLHGWKSAIGSIYATSFDATILFPKNYYSLEQFVLHLPTGSGGNARSRRMLYNNIWSKLYEQDNQVLTAIDQVASLLQAALNGQPHPRYTRASIAGLQDVCFNGRLHSTDIRTTCTRYRKGIQLAFILREMIALQWGGEVNPDQALWKILQANPRFPWKGFRDILGLPANVTDSEVNSFFKLLASTPVRMEKYTPLHLLIENDGLEHATWDADFAQFILGLRYLKATDLTSFKEAMLDLFENYRQAYGMSDILADLFNSSRIQRKIDYVADQYVGIASKDDFVSKLAGDLLTPGNNFPHQQVVTDVHNWVPDVLLTFYGLGSMQHITTELPAKFERLYGHSLSLYAFMNNLGSIVTHLLQGVPVGQYFSRNAEMAESTFYSAIWPLFAECLWDAIRTKQPITLAEAVINYRYKKAMRIISSPDLEPISFLLRRALPELTDGPTLRGAYNQLSILRGWSRSALRTDTTGRDARSGAIIQTQAVIGAKNIDHKVKELASRLRSVHLRCLSDGLFVSEPNPGMHYLVIDGDWPVESKINLYEAGFSGIFEIGELDRLSEELGSKESKS